MTFYTALDTSLFMQFAAQATQATTWIYPNTDLWEKSNPMDLNLWLIPGIAFTPDGFRVGFGAGHYDSWLQHQSGVFIGLAFELQMIGGVTIEPFDIPMDIVFTEANTYVRPQSDIDQSTLPGEIL